MKTHDTDNQVNNDFGTVMSAEYQLENRDRWRENARKNSLVSYQRSSNC